MKYDLIIFDCDGTLVDSETVLNKALSQALIDLGFLQYSSEFCLQEFTGKTSDFVEHYLQKRHPELPLAELHEKFLELASHLLPSELKAIPGASDILTYLAPHPKCVVSNGENPVVKYCLELTELKKYFPDESIFTYDIIGKAKPDPAMLLHAAQYFGVKNNRCLVIEDSLVGMQAAKAAGMDTLVVSLYKNMNVVKEAPKNQVIGFIEDLNHIKGYL
jgi:HAD superfamily hydrolase (TIGR01509 family)